jgi:enoyl-CoA hydratase
LINCDFAIAAEDALIGDFHIRRALFGGAGPIYRLPRILGLRKAKKHMLTGKLLTGREAYEWDLVNDCAPAAELDDCVSHFVANLVDKSPLRCGSRRWRSTRASTPTRAA